MHLYENRKSRFDCYTTEDIQFLSHLHKQVEILYVVQGEFAMQSNFTPYRLKQGDLFVAFPNTIHEYQGGDGSVCLLWIFDSSLLPDFSTVFRKKNAEVPILRNECLHQDVHDAALRFANRQELRQETALSKGYLSVILAHVLPALAPADIKVTEDLEWMYHVLQYLGEHYHESITLEQLAAAIGVSKYHLSRTFRARIGCSIPTYLNTLRVDQAMSMLKSGDRSITEIAYECGFESMTTFFRAFRQLGLDSPKSYRQNNQS